MEIIFHNSQDLDLKFAYEFLIYFFEKNFKIFNIFYFIEISIDFKILMIS